MIAYKMQQTKLPPSNKNTIFAHLDEYLNAFLFFPSKSGRINRAEILFIKRFPNFQCIFSDAMPKVQTREFVNFIAKVSFTHHCTSK